MPDYCIDHNENQDQNQNQDDRPNQAGKLLTDPFLQDPTPETVRVVWFTAFPGDRHQVELADAPIAAVTTTVTTAAPARLDDQSNQADRSDQANPLAVEIKFDRIIPATTRELSRTREDGASYLPAEIDRPEGERVWRRRIWRHEAVVTGLRSGDRWPYRVRSCQHSQTGPSEPSESGGVSEDRATDLLSDVFTLAAAPAPGQPLQILLTSDHQLKPLVAANLASVEALVGRVDAVFCAGDLVNVPDRASEWFDDRRGGAFFPCLQGRASVTVGDRTYQGGQLIQNAPLFPAIGNHETMGRFGAFSRADNLNTEFNDAFPRAIAQSLEPSLAEDSTGDRLADASFNYQTYSEIFSLPRGSGQAPAYYAVSFGDVRLIVLCTAMAWRPPEPWPSMPGRYEEQTPPPADRREWGWGQVLLGPIDPSSAQYQWLEQELASPACRAAKYRLVMMHHPLHTLGDNGVPAYTEPVPHLSHGPDGEVTAVSYTYPRDRDQLHQYVLPLLEKAGVHLVHFGHSHLWNRFQSHGIHCLETSNVGNTYGAAWGNDRRPVPQPEQPDYPAIGDLHGLEPITPTIDPLRDPETGAPLPFVASNDLTVFSILNTATGSIASYRVDPSQVNQPPQKFDEFDL